MARKTAIRTDNATENRIEARKLERYDCAADAAAHTPGGLLPSLAEWRAQRDQMTEREMLERAKSAARLEMRGSNYSAEDRADCAAEIMRRALLETGGAMPPRDSERHTLTVYCGVAANLRDSLNRLRARDAADMERAAAERALLPSAVGISPTPAAHAAIVARSSERAACAATDAVLASLGVSDETDGGHGWLTLYQWVTGRTAAQVADARGLGAKLAEKRIASGARFLRDFYSLTELAERLTLGARYLADGTLVYALEDRSREAHGRTPAMAEPAVGHKHWREGTNAGRRAVRAETAEEAREGCKLDKLSRAELVSHAEWRARRADLDQETADALTRIARAHFKAASREGTSAKSDSDLGRAQVVSA